MRRGDDRAVTVQIGAVLLLAILMTALAMYQLNVVPAENQQVEYDHNQQIQNELQELRNGLVNTAERENGFHSSAVTLGTRYPTRTFTMNPSNPSGTLGTSKTGSISFENIGDDDIVGSYDGNPGDLIDEDHETRTILYEPSYNEYTQPPVTRIEHGFAFNEFDGTGVGLTSQPVVDGTDLTIIQVDGDLSTSSSSAVSVDVRLESGPTDPIMIESNGDEEIEIPTQTPDAWNKSIDESNVTIGDYSEERGTLSIELDEDEKYELRMACVVVDGTGDRCGDFDITKETGETPGDGNGTVLPGPRVTELELDPDSVTQGDNVEIDAAFSNLGTTHEQRGGTPIVDAEWIIEKDDPELGDGEDLEPATGNEFSERVEEAEGTIETENLDPGEYNVSVRAQDTRGVWTNESADGLMKTFTVEEDDGDDDPARFQVEITDTNSPINSGETFEVDATVSNVGDEDGTQDIVLEIDGEQEDVAEDIEIDANNEEDLTLQWQTESGDAGENIDAVVSSDDDSEVLDITIEDDVGDPSFGVTDIEPADDVQEFTFTANNLGNADTVTIDISDAENGVEYGDELEIYELEEQDIDTLEYQDGSITFTPQGNPNEDTLTIAISIEERIEFDSYTVGYIDETGRAASDSFDVIESDVPDFATLEATANDNWFFVTFTNSVEFNYEIAELETFEEVEFVVSDGDGTEVDSVTSDDTTGEVSAEFDPQTDPVTAEATIRSTAGNRCLETDIDIGETVTLDDWEELEQCD
ncbi:COG1361 family protein [Natronobacterium lacisalsi]|nr:hypothetical protein [Halobiforma lacisalsi]